MNEVVGRLVLHARGFGFLEVEGALPPLSLFVPPPELKGRFLRDDRVSAEQLEGNDGRFSARSLRLLERPRQEVAGEVVRRRGQLLLRPDPLVAREEWPLRWEGPPPAAGTWVLARPEGEALRGLAAIPEDELGALRVLVRWGIPHAFSPTLEEAARGARLAPGERRDLREVPTVTIDGPSTKDIDDALAALPAQPDGAVRVLVSIADVDACVPEGSPLDLEARRRGTSVYLPDRVVPMFPRALSEEALSLLPGQDRPALTVELRIDPEGQITAVDISPSLIRSHARLTYTGAAAFLDLGQADEVPAEVQPTLRWLRTAAARLATVRAARGGASVYREEASLTLDADTREPTGLQPEEETSAHKLVERLMVAANEAVAAWLVARGLPGMYRVHPAPPPERSQRLAAFAHNFGFATGFGPALTPRSLAAFEEQFQSSRVAPALRTVLRRLLGPARYDVHPGLHFGLAAPLYLHFTSPIRRYADLVVHRLVKAHLAGQRDLRAGDPQLQTLAASLSELGRRAARAESERSRMLVARLFANRAGQVHPAHVVGVQPFGLVVQLDGLGVRGTVALEHLPGGPLQVDEELEALRDAAGATRFQVGEPLVVEVAGADEELGRIDLRPVS